MEFKMHKSGLHYYDPRKEHHMTFVNTVSENKTGFTKRQIKCEEIARNLYKTLSYLSMKDFKWVIRSNQIKDLPVTIQYIDVATKIWGKSIASPKGKTVESRTRDRAKAEPGLLKKIVDPAIFNQSSGKSVSIFPRGSSGPGKTLKSRSLLHLTSKG
jgi:hypothetical protein